MANARTVDIKVKFDPTDMTPGAKGRKFRRDVFPLKAWSIRGYIEHTNNCRVVGKRGGFVGFCLSVTSWWLMLKRGMRVGSGEGGFCATYNG